MSSHSVSYLALNLVGALALAVAAVLGPDWGFLVLEIAWALLSSWSLLELARGREPSRSG